MNQQGFVNVLIESSYYIVGFNFGLLDEAGDPIQIQDITSGAAITEGLFVYDVGANVLGFAG